MWFTRPSSDMESACRGRKMPQCPQCPFGLHVHNDLPRKSWGEVPIRYMAQGPDPWALNQAVTWGEDGDVDYVDGGGSLLSAARTGVQRLPCWLPPLPLLSQWPGDSSRGNDFLHKSYAG